LVLVVDLVGPAPHVDDLPAVRRQFRRRYGYPVEIKVERQFVTALPRYTGGQCRGDDYRKQRSHVPHCNPPGWLKTNWSGFYGGNPVRSRTERGNPCPQDSAQGTS